MKRTSIILATIFFMATTAAASYIDFRDQQFKPAKNQTSFSITPISSSINLEFTPGPDGATLWWDEIDGFGVQYDYEKDEIEGAEWLRLDFSPKVFLFEIHFTDLFKELGYREIGFYEINDSGLAPFFADPGQTSGTNGELTLTIDFEGPVESIRFRAPGEAIKGEKHEYAVARIKAEAVPIPGAVWLLGSGLFGLVLIRRRFRS